MSVKNVKEMQPTTLVLNLVQSWRSQTDRQTDRRTDRQADSSIPPLNYVAGGYKDIFFTLQMRVSPVSAALLQLSP